MITVYSPTETNFADNGLGVLEPLSCDVSITINEVWSLELTQPIDEDGKYNNIEKNNIIKITDMPVVREQTNAYQLFRIYDTVRDVFAGTIKAIAFPVAFEATYDAIIEELKCEKKTATAALQDIMTYLSQHGVTKYTVTSDYTGVTARQRKGSWTNTNLIAAISGSDDGSIINHWGGEVAYDNYHIVVNGQLGADSDAEIRCGKNLTGLSVDTDMSGVVTRLYPYSSDNVRLSRPEGNTNVPYVDSVHISDYPFVRAAFVKVDDKLVDTSWELNAVNTDAAIYTHQAQVAITNAVKEYAQTLWTRICAGEKYNNIIFVEPEWLKTVLNDVIANLQKYFTDSIDHPSYKNLIKTCIKDGFSWIKDSEIEDYAWDGNYDDGYTYGNTERTIKGQYLFVDKKYRYFNSTGEYEPWKDIAVMDWIQPKNSNTKKKFGDNKRYYAKDTYIYTWNGEHQGGNTACEYWFDGDGYWDGVSETETEWDWHDAGPYWWFGEDGASESDTNKYAHDCWLYIFRSSKGLYYFDEKGKLVDDLTISNPNWDWREADKGGKYYFGDTNKAFDSVYIKNQWLKIDGTWRKFDNDGFNVEHDTIKQALITALKNAMNTGINTIITTQRGVLDDVLYTSMIDQCHKMFEEGYDLPVINIKANIVDLSKTEDYANFVDLETIHLGDKIKVIDYVHGYHVNERVVGLKFDCIRGYNTEVTINDPTRLFAQLNMNTNLGGNGGGTTRMDYVAGDNVTIDNDVINVSVPSGDVYAGDQVSVSPTITQGRKIASIYVNGVENRLYGGNDVSITPRLNQGTKVADYSIDGNNGSLYAPSGLQYWTETQDDIYRVGQREGLKGDSSYYKETLWNWRAIGEAGDHRFDFKRTSALPVLCCQDADDTDYFLLVSIYSDAVDYMWRRHTDYYESPWYSWSYSGDFHGAGTKTSFEYCGSTWYVMRANYIGTGTPYIEYGAFSTAELGLVAEHTIVQQAKAFIDVAHGSGLIDDVFGISRGEHSVYYNDDKEGNYDTPQRADKWWVGKDGSFNGTDFKQNGASIIPSDMVGATSQDDGTHGLVPAPSIAEKDKFLRGDGTWQDASEIEANPSGTATGTLEKVEIDGTIYEVGGESNLEDLEDVNINNVVGGEMLIYDEASQKWINGTGGGSEITTDIMQDHSKWVTKANSSQSAGWNLGTDILSYSCSNNNDVGAQAVYSNAIPASVKKIRFRIETGTQNKPSASTDYDVCIGVKATYDATNFANPSENDWIVKRTYSTEQSTFEAELDIVATTPFYLYITGHSWNLSIEEVELVEYASGGGSSDSYSTTEQEIGTWINNEPLYRKVFQITGQQYLSQTFQLQGVPSDANLIKAEGTCSFTHGGIRYSYILGDYSEYPADGDKTAIKIWLGSVTVDDLELNLIIYYTKSS